MTIVLPTTSDVTRGLRVSANEQAGERYPPPAIDPMAGPGTATDYQNKLIAVNKNQNPTQVR